MRYRKNAASKYQNSSQRHIYSHAFFIFFFCWMGLLFSPHFKMKMWIHCLYITQIAKDMKQFIKVLQMSWFFLCFRLFFTYYDVVRHCYMKNNSRRKLLVWSTSWKLWRKKKIACSDIFVWYLNNSLSMRIRRHSIKLCKISLKGVRIETCLGWHWIIFRVDSELINLE